MPFKKGNIPTNAGKTYEEIYGIEKANDIKMKVSQTSKERYDSRQDIKDNMEKGRRSINGRRSEIAKEVANRPSVRAKLKQANIKFLESEAGKEYRIRVSQKMKLIKAKEWQDPNHYYNTQEYRNTVSIGRKEQWKNPESVRKWMLSNRVKPNGKEKELLNIIQRISHNTFDYNGDARFGIVISGKTPDYVNINGKKQVIELFGDWWHGKKKTGREPHESEEILKAIYKNFGFECLIIWEKEMEDKDTLEKKIAEFICRE